MARSHQEPKGAMAEEVEFDGEGHISIGEFSLDASELESPVTPQEVAAEVRQSPRNHEPEVPDEEPLEISMPAAEAGELAPDSSGAEAEELAQRLEQLDASELESPVTPQEVAAEVRQPPRNHEPEVPDEEPLEVSMPAAEAGELAPDSSGAEAEELARRIEQLEASLAAQLRRSHAALLQNSQHRIWGPLTKIWQHQLDFVQHLDDKLAELGGMARRQRLILSYCFPLTWLGLLLLAALLIFR